MQRKYSSTDWRMEWGRAPLGQQEGRMVHGVSGREHSEPETETNELSLRMRRLWLQLAGNQEEVKSQKPTGPHQDLKALGGRLETKS